MSVALSPADHTWRVYAQLTDTTALKSGYDNASYADVGLAAAYFNVVGSQGIAITSSAYTLPSGLISISPLQQFGFYFLSSSGNSGAFIRESQYTFSSDATGNVVLTGVGLTPGSASGVTWNTPALMGSGTYTGQTGTVLAYPQGGGSGFSLLIGNSAGQWGGPLAVENAAAVNPAAASAGYATGVWDNGWANGRWDNTSINFSGFAWVGGAMAIFGPTGAGNVTVRGLQTASSISFTAPGYYLSGGSLVLGSGGIDTEADTSIRSSITSGGVAKRGSGALTLSGTNTYAGGTSVSDGVLVIAGADTLPAGGMLMIGSLIAQTETEMMVASAKLIPGSSESAGGLQPGTADSLLPRNDALGPSAIRGKISVVPEPSGWLLLTVVMGVAAGVRIYLRYRACQRGCRWGRIACYP